MLNSDPIDQNECSVVVFILCNSSFLLYYAGGSSATHFAVFIFPAGDALRDPLSALLWVAWELDSLSH